MLKYYVMYAADCIEDYVKIDDGLDELINPCSTSEFQFLDETPLTVEISLDGDIFPDFLIHREVIPLVSTKFRDFLIKAGAKWLFYKPITLTCSATEDKEKYFLALPPRISCLN